MRVNFFLFMVRTSFYMGKLYKRGDVFEFSVQTPPRALDLGTCNFNMFCAEVCRVICNNPFFDILNGSGKNPEKLICN